MSTQMANIDLNSAAQTPSYLQAFQSQMGKNLVVGGAGRNRIGLKGNRFRLIVNGQEEGIVDENYLDVVIVGAAPGVSRIFYADKYDPKAETKASPTCYSREGVRPEADSKNVQSDKCQTCPQNEKGSRITEDGNKTRACGFFKRLALILPSDPSRVFQLDCKSMSIFGEGKAAQNKFTLGEYGKKLATRGLDPAHLITRLSFDTDSSVPKVLFSPTRYLDQDEAPLVADVVKGDEVKAILEITAHTTDLSHEVDAPEEAPAPAPAPVAAKPTPTITKAPAGPTVAKAAAPVVTRQPATKPTVTVAPKAAAPAPVQEEAPAASSEDDDLAALLAQLDAE